MWYLTDQVDLEPNFDQLNNALTQTDWHGPILNSSNWKMMLAKRIRATDFSKVLEDVDPFLEKKEESEMLTMENFLKLLGSGD